MKDKTVLLIGAGQSPGEGIGNGRAAALLYAREGAQVLAVDILAVDIDEASARETVASIESECHAAIAMQADVRDEQAVPPLSAIRIERYLNGSRPYIALHALRDTRRSIARVAGR